MVLACAASLYYLTSPRSYTSSLLYPDTENSAVGNTSSRHIVHLEIQTSQPTLFIGDSMSVSVRINPIFENYLSLLDTPVTLTTKPPTINEVL